jgi:hypothetical protein
MLPITSSSNHGWKVALVALPEEEVDVECQRRKELGYRGGELLRGRMQVIVGQTKRDPRPDLREAARLHGWCRCRSGRGLRH